MALRKLPRRGRTYLRLGSEAACRLRSSMRHPRASRGARSSRLRGRSPEATPRLLQHQDRLHDRRVLWRLVRAVRRREHLVLTARRRLPRTRLHAPWVPGLLRRSPADLQLPAGELGAWDGARERTHGRQLRMVGPQAQRTSRLPESRRPRSRPGCDADPTAQRRCGVVTAPEPDSCPRPGVRGRSSH